MNNSDNASQESYTALIDISELIESSQLDGSDQTSLEAVVTTLDGEQIDSIVLSAESDPQAILTLDIEQSHAGKEAKVTITQGDDTVTAVSFAIILPDPWIDDNLTLLVLKNAIQDSQPGSVIGSLGAFDSETGDPKNCQFEINGELQEFLEIDAGRLKLKEGQTDCAIDRATITIQDSNSGLTVEKTVSLNFEPASNNTSENEVAEPGQVEGAAELKGEEQTEEHSEEADTQAARTVSAPAPTISDQDPAEEDTTDLEESLANAEDSFEQEDVNPTADLAHEEDTEEIEEPAGYVPEPSDVGDAEAEVPESQYLQAEAEITGSSSNEATSIHEDIPSEEHLAEEIELEEPTASIEEDLSPETESSAAETPEEKSEPEPPSSDYFQINIPENFQSSPIGKAKRLSVALPDGTEIPDWLQLDAESGQLSGTPSPADVGMITIRVTSEDESNAAEDYFAVMVEAIHNRTVARAITNTQTEEKKRFTFSLSEQFAKFELGENISFSATLLNGSSLPDWLELNEQSGELQGTPSAEDNGSWSLLVIASDGENSSNISLCIEVENTDDGPVATFLPEEEYESMKPSEINQGLGNAVSVATENLSAEISGGDGSDNPESTSESVSVEFEESTESSEPLDSVDDTEEFSDEPSDASESKESLEEEQTAHIDAEKVSAEAEAEATEVEIEAEEEQSADEQVDTIDPEEEADSEDPTTPCDLDQEEEQDKVDLTPEATLESDDSIAFEKDEVEANTQDIEQSQNFQDTQETSCVEEAVESSTSNEEDCSDELETLEDQVAAQLNLGVDLEFDESPVQSADEGQATEESEAEEEALKYDNTLRFDFEQPEEPSSNAEASDRSDTEEPLHLSADDIFDIKTSGNRLFVAGDADNANELSEGYAHRGIENIDGVDYNHFYDANSDTHLYIGKEIPDTKNSLN